MPEEQSPFPDRLGPGSSSAKLFRSDLERDDHRFMIDRLASAAQLLPLLARDPEFLRYRLVVAGTDRLLLPSSAELTRAADVLQQAAACLRDNYVRRARPEDEAGAWGVTDGKLEGDLEL